ncbi:hypothetical protein B4135_0738 [Caldibacillus debilis]|uniref:Uncharacterized protein n=1 Tax=Caldibacillus debilis TaxID=301148 RepID=A0A150M6W4_9BACI|nr:hypothetical protein B4135_0738 [Caldibacillus debilis]
MPENRRCEKGADAKISGEGGLNRTAAGIRKILHHPAAGHRPAFLRKNPPLSRIDF